LGSWIQGWWGSWTPWVFGCPDALVLEAVGCQKIWVLRVVGCDGHLGPPSSQICGWWGSWTLWVLGW